MKKISAKYKLLMMMPLLMLNGCNNKAHKCVVEVVKDNKILATDMETGKYKIFVTNSARYDHLNYVYQYDTIIFHDDGHLGYNKNCIIDVPGKGYLQFDKDSIYARQDRRLLARVQKEHWFKHR